VSDPRPFRPTCLFLAHLSRSDMVSFCEGGSSVVHPSTIVVCTLADGILVRSSVNLVRMFISMISRSSSKLGHVILKSRSLGQIKKKSFPHSSGCNFGAIFFQIGQNVNFNDI